MSDDRHGEVEYSEADVVVVGGGSAGSTAAIVGLRELKDVRAVPALVRALADAGGEVRREAVITLAYLRCRTRTGKFRKEPSSLSGQAGRGRGRPGAPAPAAKRELRSAEGGGLRAR